MTTLLSVNNYYYHRGGAETVFLEHNRMFGEQGWIVVPFCMKHPRNMQTQWSEFFVDEIEFGSQYSFREKLIRVPKVVYSIEARRKLLQLIDQVRPDVCHAHNIYNHISPSILGLLRDRQIPTLLTLHDLKVACPAYNMLTHDGVCERCKGGRIHNVLLNRCVKGSAVLSGIMMLEAGLHAALQTYRKSVDRFIVPSNFYIKKLTEWGMPAEKFTHVPNFVDVGRYQPRYDPGHAFVYFGRLSREKGLVTLIKAAAAARAALVVIGTGPQLEELKVTAARLNAAVEFRGYMTGDPLREAVRSARAVVLPSEWYENAPMTLLEAYALGKPVIGARIGGIPELIREGETGVTYPSGDVDALASVLQRFGPASTSDLQLMGQAGRRWVESEFTAEHYRLRILNVYRELGIDTCSKASPDFSAQVGQ